MEENNYYSSTASLLVVILSIVDELFLIKYMVRILLKVIRATKNKLLNKKTMIFMKSIKHKKRIIMVIV